MVSLEMAALAPGDTCRATAHGSNIYVGGMGYQDPWDIRSVAACTAVCREERILRSPNVTGGSRNGLPPGSVTL